MTLDGFLKENRAELIERARAKVVARSSRPTDSKHTQGVPMFLSQLSAALGEQGSGGVEHSTRASHAAHPAISESAAVHGRDLLKLGLTIDEVVHDYGDVCQAVTELAEERNATLSIAEFHTLNRCLDNAIAGAVSAWSEGREHSQANAAKAADTLSRSLGRLVDRARATFDVICTGRVAAGGATGNLLRRDLAEMRALIDQAETK
jgi:hypothetical protein